MQHKDTFTIKELTELFGISRQAISQHLKKLSPEFKTKNGQGHILIFADGVKLLANKLDKYELFEGLHPRLQGGATNSIKSIDKIDFSEGATWLHPRLQGSNHSVSKNSNTGFNNLAIIQLLEQQLTIKDSQLKNKDVQLTQMQNLLDQQQQLHLKVQQDLTQSLENNQQLLEEKTQLLNLAQQKKWWQFWK